MADRRHITNPWIGKLLNAERAEAEARDSLRQRRSHVAKLIADAVANGVSHDKIARGVLCHRLGRAPSVEERRREVERLKKRRRRGTACPPGLRADALKQARSAVGSVKHMSERLIRRQTVEEEFIKNEEKDTDLDCEDGKDAAAAEIEADDDEEEEDEEADEE